MITGLVGHYRVVTTLGAGGMGVVYKAIDTRLNRPVAIKALSEKQGADTNATLRLRREALAAASLDHPYICKIYELLDTDDGTLIVMEFVEGETLSQVLARGVPPLLDTLRYGAEIAEGLANAHSRGLVHRDIKPSNIMVTPHGHVKLLDFGVVRIAELGSGVTETQSGLTRPGAVAGTPLYMAPEQALGLPVDGRADLFSLGTVLFECLTGQLPFEAATRDGYVQAMLQGRVKSIEQCAPRTPPAVARIVRQCLEGDRSRRLDSAATLAAELGRAADMLSGTAMMATARRRSWIGWTLQLTAVALAVVALAGAYRLWRASQEHRDGAARTMVAAVTWPSAETEPRISPDGRWLSFQSDRDGVTRLFVQPINGGNATPLEVAGSSVMSHAWSPDGKEIACVVRQGERTSVQVVPAFFGGVPRVSVPIEPPTPDIRVMRWIGDTVFLDARVRFGGRGLLQVILSTADVQDLRKTWPSSTPPHRAIDISPDGRAVVFAAKVDGQDDLWTAAVDGTNLRRVTNDSFTERDPLWVGATGVVAYQSGRSGQLDLWELDVASGRTTQLTSSPTIELPSGSTSDGASLAFEQTAQSATLWMLEAGAREARQLTADALSDFWPSVSADGSRLAFQRAGSTVREGVQYFDSRILLSNGPPSGTATLPGGLSPAEQLQSIGDGFGARLSPDATWIAYLQRSADPTRMILQARNIRTGEQRLVWEQCPPVALSSSLPVDWAQQHLAWSPLGAELFFVGTRDNAPFIGRAALGSAATSDVVVLTARTEIWDIHPSADGTQLAYLIQTPKVKGATANGDSFELRAHDLRTGQDTLILQQTRPGLMMLRGWTSASSLLLIGARLGATTGFDTDVFEVSLSGTARPIGSVGDAFVTTARLDPWGRRLLFTRAEAGVHNIVALSLADGGLHRLTDNRLPGVSFAGLEPMTSGGLVYSRPEWRRDIWLAQRAAR